jgi:DNA uptake protein ComE-like DNA-binding protein
MLSRFRVVMGIAALALTASLLAAHTRPVEPGNRGELGNLVDLNRATVAELMRVPGMTASWAARIVRFRPYRTKLDLLEQGVVTPEVYQHIRDRVVAHRVAAGE